MGMSSADREAVRALVTEMIHDESFRRATFGGAARAGESPWARVVVRPLDLRGRRHLQFSYFDGRKDIARNFLPEEVSSPLSDILALEFAGIHLSTNAEEVDVRTTKKGKVHIGRRSPAATDSVAREHNRIKDVPLPEGKADHLLEVMGVMTAEGRVRPTMRAKYTQINEFLKHLRHAMEDAGLHALGRPVEILDCGCGASYLTLAVHHYLTNVLAIPARITGVDVNDEVIRKSLARADRLETADLAFACESIGRLEARPDVVLALHACDTATDDALARAATTRARLILVVPCCHKAMNRHIHPEGEADVLLPLLRHGILRQRTADLVTDAFRAQILRIMGYRTDVVEFVTTEHTARNLMIRAMLTNAPADPADLRDYEAMRRFWNVTPYLETRLGEGFRERCGGSG